MAKLSESNAVTEYDSGLALSAVEKNPSVEGTLANQIANIDVDGSGTQVLSGSTVYITLSDQGNDETGVAGYNVPEGKRFRTISGSRYVWDKYDNVYFMCRSNLDLYEDKTTCVNNKHIRFLSGEDNTNIAISLPNMVATNCVLAFYGLTINSHGTGKNPVDLRGNIGLYFGGYGALKINDGVAPLFCFNNITSERAITSLFMTVYYDPLGNRSEDHPIILHAGASAYTLPVMLLSKGPYAQLNKKWFARGSYNATTGVLNITKSYIPVEIATGSETCYFKQT